MSNIRPTESRRQYFSNFTWLVVAALYQGAPGQITWQIHRPGSSPGSALPSHAYCFASVIVNRKFKKCYHIWPLYLFYLDGETALAACVL